MQPCQLRVVAVPANTENGAMDPVDIELVAATALDPIAIAFPVETVALPIEIAFVLSALALTPIAIALVDIALVPLPTEIAPCADAAEFAPIATAFNAALDVSPIETAASPVDAEPNPTMVLLVPPAPTFAEFPNIVFRAPLVNAVPEADPSMTLLAPDFDALPAPCPIVILEVAATVPARALSPSTTAPEGRPLAPFPNTTDVDDEFAFVPLPYHTPSAATASGYVGVAAESKTGIAFGITCQDAVPVPPAGLIHTTVTSRSVAIVARKFPPDVLMVIAPADWFRN